AFFRGSAPLFYEVLAARPEIAGEPLPGRGWIVGDMHLENVGAFRADSGAVVFDLNDFDDATVGPWQADVLRLAVRTLLAGRGGPGQAEVLRLAVGTLLAVRAARPSGADALAAAEAMLRSWRAGVEGDPGPPRPREVERLLQRAARRTDDDLLAGRAPLAGGH